jgi:hypothetical protein
VLLETLKPFSIGQMVMRYVKAAGLDPSDFGEHWLRASLIASAVVTGGSLFRTMDPSLHRRVQTSVRIRPASREIEDHTVDGLA